MKILYLILFFSVLFNLLILVIDTIPFLWLLFKRKFLRVKQKEQVMDYKDLEKSLVRSAEKMIKSEKVLMVWNDHRGFTEKAYDYIRNGSNYKFKTYNYPRAYLYYGLSEYYITNKDRKGLDMLKKCFDGLLNDKGVPIFSLDKVDQAPFGLVAITLYKIYKEEKYKLFYTNIYKYLLGIRDENKIIKYRQESNSQIQLNDLLGMIIPFLVEYYKITLDLNALEIAKAQLHYYIKYGVDKDTFIPAHGINMHSKIKTGSINWGRGIGWYLLGLASYHSITSEYMYELNGIFESLNKLKTKDNLFSQFPGSNNIFDASTSTMFLYAFSFLKNSKMDKYEILKLFSPYIDKNGKITNTSGDTYGLNSYSQSFGYSELSQGVLLLLLSKTVKTNDN